MIIDIIGESKPNTFRTETGPQMCKDFIRDPGGPADHRGIIYEIQDVQDNWLAVR